MSAFSVLSKIDVSEHTEKKGKFTYLSWAWAVRTLLEHFPEATWIVHEYDDGLGNGFTNQPYMQTPAGAFVQVTVNIDSVKRTQVHPVLDHMNKTVIEPNAFQINNSIQRCLAKAIALHGLGLYIYAGEDLPQAPDALNKEQYKSMLDLLAIIGDKEFEAKIVAQIGDETINDANYKAAFNKLKRKADKVKKAIDELDEKRASK
tara:strand:- start:108 stop:719 length:612 start_codon:yes stop_codon:yes gene_type:complete